MVSRLRTRSSTLYNVLMAAVPNVENALGDLDMCDFALTIEGVLSKPTKYYTIENDDDMDMAISEKGVDIINRLTLSTNSSISAPLLDSVQQVGMIRIFLSSSMLTIVFFLFILSSQLVYSLMLSDVEEKTY